jgi:hypothetical protein
MAYNILKDDVEFSGVNLGTIEDMVDDHRDQSIGGVKTFTDMITASAGVSASVYYGDGSGLSGISSSPGGVEGSIQFNTSSTLGGNSGFKYDGTDVTLGGALSASFLSGSGANIYNITPANINGTINAGQLNLGDGLEDNSNALRIKLDSDSAINRSGNGIKIQASGLSAAGALSDTDLFIADQSGNKKATALQIYSYVNGKLTIPVVAGSDTQIQFNDSGDLGASSNLTFNSSTNTLTTTNITASTHVSASTYYGDGSNLSGISGGSSTSFNSFTANFNVSASYDVVGVNTSGGAVTGSLLAANAYTAGQRLVFKDIEGSGSTNNLVIEPSGSQTIDGATLAKIKVNYGSITIVSDGSGAFYIVGNN